MLTAPSVAAAASRLICRTCNWPSPSGNVGDGKGALVCPTSNPQEGRHCFLLSNAARIHEGERSEQSGLTRAHLNGRAHGVAQIGGDPEWRSVSKRVLDGRSELLEMIAEHAPLLVAHDENGSR